MWSMNKESRQAWRVIRRCVAAGHYLVLPHFAHRMDQRGLFWPDVQAVIDKPSGVRDDGRDSLDRPKWIITGTATDGLSIEIVCVLDEHDRGRLTVFITVY